MMIYKIEKKNKIALFIIIICSALIFGGCGEQELKEEDTTNFNKLNWLLGIWEGKQNDSDIYESWRKKNYRIMEGFSSTKVNGVKVYSQNMTIEQSNNIIHYFLKLDEGKEQLELILDSVTDSNAVFKNDRNQYPNEIVYSRLTKNKMKVFVTGEGGKEIDSVGTNLIYKKTD